MFDSPEFCQNANFKDRISRFISDRLAAKIEAFSSSDPRRANLVAEFHRDTWLHNAARRVKQIQAVTHSLKPVHPEARGTNLYVKPADLPTLEELGTHAVGERFAVDVTGNAAALDVYKLLKLESGGRTLLDALQSNASDAIAALSDNPAEARVLRDAFISLTAVREGSIESHTWAKQVYWLIGDDAADNTQYHLLSPLYATSLAQAVFDDVHDARFGESNKLARSARRNGQSFDGVYREYRQLAVQRLGGTKPQNISQLNSERGGINYLLASLPPAWRDQKPSLPARTRSVFEYIFGARREVRANVMQLVKFLQTNPVANRDTRDTVRAYVNRLVDEMTLYAGELSHHPAGWSRASVFDELSDEEKLWLDPLRVELPDESEFADRWMSMDWPMQIGEHFGKWLTARLTKDLIGMGYEHSHEWRRILLNELSSWVQDLREQSRKVQAYAYISFRSKHDDIFERREAT
ncbi:type I-F CRISPR-associated protein Csy1 [Paraburkholderia sp. Ac-20340]|uniref:type I-F CRISPR-associated protein Csy1 n=1 Tax=Paraburkholderia sp. Ac-20340 TaxID=2703888 RepID=UPI001980783C|nr:type I-F CRISPR-associated protein Csy1 [Paraburkholderia sp. Ac-20340]MBN3857921.1 type I-F CRISPR-associated protein Csy1 [Paraburkholderia sp. Ac-20340]